MRILLIVCIASLFPFVGISAGDNYVTVTRGVDDFLSSSKLIGSEAIRQNQFNLDIEHGKVDCVEIWIVPSKNFILVKGGSLGAASIEELQNGINAAKLELNNQLVIFNGRVYSAQPLQGGWREVKGVKPSLGYGRDLQLELSSFNEYNMKRAFWNNLLKKSPEGSPSYEDAKKNLQMLVPKNGFIDYENGSGGLKIWLTEEGKLARSQTLEDGIVFFEIQNAFEKSLPENIISIISDIKNESDSNPQVFLNALRGKKALGMYIIDSPDGLQQIVWIAPSGPAAKAGLKCGDIIEKINGKDVRSMEKEQIKDLFEIGENFNFLVKRSNSEVQIPSVSKTVFNP